MDPPQTAVLDSMVEAAMQEGSIPGLAPAVAQEGQLMVAKVYGYANLEHMVPVTAHTVF